MLPVPGRGWSMKRDEVGVLVRLKVAGKDVVYKRITELSGWLECWLVKHSSLNRCDPQWVKQELLKGGCAVSSRT